MRRIISSDALTILSRLVIGGLFIYASIYKIADPASFGKSIWFYHIIPNDYINVIAIFMPWLEALVGLGLILGIYYRGAVLWVNLLLIIFLAALVSTVVRGIDIDCGCFKAAAASTGSAMDEIYLDIVLLLLGIQLLFSKSRNWQIANLF